MSGIKAVLVGVGSLVALIAIVIGVWAAGVATSGVHGRGEQIKQVNSATNRTFQYIHFRDLFSTVQSQTDQVRQSQAAAEQFRKDHGGQSDNALGTNANEQARLDSVLLGLRNLCAQNLNQYNNDAQKVLTGAQFRDHNLPDRLPVPGADCGGQA